MEAWEEAPWPEGNEVIGLYWRHFGIPLRDYLSPSPSVTYSISGVYGERYTTLINDLNTKMLAAFRECVAADGRMFVIDWQHPSYWFYPHAPFDADDPKAWLVPILPNGDYFYFLAEDATFRSLGHPWEMSITIYGAPLIDAVSYDKPLLFDFVMRSNGVSALP